MTLRGLSFLTTVILVGSVLHAKEAVVRIQNDPGYYSAEGEGYDVYDAKEKAMLLINNRIASWVSSTTEDSSVSEGDVNYVSRSSEVKQFALTALQDVDYLV